jgi:hypothetical protein
VCVGENSNASHACTVGHEQIETKARSADRTVVLLASRLIQRHQPHLWQCLR